jgi:hypothetical protein
VNVFEDDVIPMLLFDVRVCEYMNVSNEPLEEMLSKINSFTKKPNLPVPVEQYLSDFFYSNESEDFFHFFYFFLFQYQLNELMMHYYYYMFDLLVMVDEDYL